MLPICYQFRDESLLQMRNNSTIAVGINFLTLVIRQMKVRQI